MTLEQHIAEFLRDAQYRFGELSAELNEKSNRRIKDYEYKNKLRIKLMIFLNLLYTERYKFKDNEYNFSNWESNDIVKEIEYFRYELGLNKIPYVTFAGYSPLIQVNNSLVIAQSGTDGEISDGAPGQNAVYTGTNTIGPQTEDTVVGFDDSGIDTYFS